MLLTKSLNQLPVWLLHLLQLHFLLTPWRLFVPWIVFIVKLLGCALLLQAQLNKLLSLQLLKPVLFTVLLNRQPLLCVDNLIDSRQLFRSLTP